jgi:hypothetical protein
MGFKGRRKVAAAYCQAINSEMFGRPASRRTMSLKPSSLISGIQPEPIGGRSAGNGRQGSMKPVGGARRERSNMEQR